MLLRQHRGPLAADFRRYYGLSLAHIADYGIPAREIAAYAAHLPQDSAVGMATNPDWWITGEVHLLRAVEHRLRLLVWAKTEDATKGRRQPEPLKILHAELEAEKAEKKKRSAEIWGEYDVVPMDQMDKLLGWNRARH